MNFDGFKKDYIAAQADVASLITSIDLPLPDMGDGDTWQAVSTIQILSANLSVAIMTTLQRNQFTESLMKSLAEENLDAPNEKDFSNACGEGISGREYFFARANPWRDMKIPETTDQVSCENAFPAIAKNADMLQNFLAQFPLLNVQNMIDKNIMAGWIIQTTTGFISRMVTGMQKLSEGMSLPGAIEAANKFQPCFAVRPDSSPAKPASGAPMGLTLEGAQ